jgi:hypothetical protein
MGCGQKYHSGSCDYTHVLQHRLDSRFRSYSLQLYVTRRHTQTKSPLNTRQTANPIGLKAISRPTRLHEAPNITHSNCGIGCKHAFPVIPTVLSFSENVRIRYKELQEYFILMEIDSSFEATTLYRSRIPILRSVICGVQSQATSLYSRKKI